MDPSPEQLVPAPEEVISLVASLVRSAWPTTEDEQTSWSDRHGLDISDARREWGEDGSDHYGGRGPQRWGRPRTGRHLFQGELAGVSWFLWAGDGARAVGQAAELLREGFTRLAGEPADHEVLADGSGRFTAFWQVDGCTIELYLHGGRVLGGDRAEDPVVQLHVDHAERSRLAEQAAAGVFGGVALQIGGRPRADVLRALADAGVALNEHAETLLADPRFDAPDPQGLRVAVKRVEQLGLPEGGTLAEVVRAGRGLGLEPCPLITGPYLRLAKLAQPEAPDSVLSAGRAPTGAIHVISDPISSDVAVPKGFYLRVVDGRPWLRGYRCDDSYVFGPEQVVALALQQS